MIKSCSILSSFLLLLKLSPVLLQFHVFLPLFKVPRVLLGPFKSLEIDFSIKGLLSPLIQPMGPSVFQEVLSIVVSSFKVHL